MKHIIYFILITVTMLQSCKNTESKDKTPVADVPLEELAPDATFDDIKTIFDIVSSDPNYNSFVKLMNIAYVIDNMKNLEDMTVFAPTNAAVNRLTDEQYAELKLPQNLEKLRSLLNYHIVKGEQDAATLKSTISAKGTPLRLLTLQGAYISLNINEKNKLIITDEMSNTSVVSEPDKEASNGVIHGISNVLMPQ